MSNNEKDRHLVEQPLMSTGSTEAGFKEGTKRSQPSIKPKIGETIVGDKV